MSLLWEKIVVTAKEFVGEKNINDCRDLNEPIYQSKLQDHGWDIQFAASSILCEIVWKIAIGRESLREWRQIDRLFCPSPIAVHANFRGCREYKTGNLPEKGSLVIWRRGNSWQGHMAIVIEVSEDKRSFDVVEARMLMGSDNRFLQVEERKDKKTDLPFRNDKLNIIGFIYAPDREIR